MNCIRSPCRGELTKIGQNSMPNISTSWSINTISYLCANQFSHWIWQPLLITEHGLDIMVSHIYCRRRKGLGNVIIGCQNDPAWILGREYMSRWSHHQLQPHTRHWGVHHLPVSIAHIVLVLSLILFFYTSTTLCTIVPSINTFCRCIFCTTSIPNTI